MEYCNIFIAEYQYNQYNNNIIVPSAEDRYCEGFWKALQNIVTLDKLLSLQHFSTLCKPLHSQFSKIWYWLYCPKVLTDSPVILLYHITGESVPLGSTTCTRFLKIGIACVE